MIVLFQQCILHIHHVMKSYTLNEAYRLAVGSGIDIKWNAFLSFLSKKKGSFDHKKECRREYPFVSIWRQDKTIISHHVIYKYPYHFTTNFSSRNICSRQGEWVKKERKMISALLDACSWCGVVWQWRWRRRIKNTAWSNFPTACHIITQKSTKKKKKHKTRSPVYKL